MDYSFEPFLRALETNWFDDDGLLHRLLEHYADESSYDGPALSRWGERVAGPLRELADAAAQTTDLPRIDHYDAYGRRADRIVLPDSTLRALAEVEGRERLGAVHGDPYVFYARGYLYGQNGEAGVVCSLGCTDGMVRVLEGRGEGEEHRRAVQRIRGSTPERIWHGAQFVTEPQGGSDVPANRVEALREGDRWRIRGRKWFCSNINADYFLVTARTQAPTEGKPGIGLFLVPAYLDDAAGDNAAGQAADGLAPLRNGYTIDRLKDKLGTRQLATAEVTFQGAVAYPIGPLESGLSNLLRYVLTTSRFYCVQSAASTLRQAERIACAYADFRTAFGHRLSDFPLIRERLAEIRQARQRALACYFELLRLWQESESDANAATDFRILLSMAKPVLTMTATRLAQEAMIVLGGNGIEERFSPLPRLYRDALIMEIWEGPHDLLFTQALRDLQRFAIDGEEFLTRVAGGDGAPDGGREAETLGAELTRLLTQASEGSGDVTVPFRQLVPRIVEAVADRVLARAGAYSGG